VKEGIVELDAQHCAQHGWVVECEWGFVDIFAGTQDGIESDHGSAWWFVEEFLLDTVTSPHPLAVEIGTVLWGFLLSQGHPTLVLHGNLQPPHEKSTRKSLQLLHHRLQA
jgi:hypothetical protein